MRSSKPKVRYNADQQVIDVPREPTYKAPVKPFTESEFIQNYRADRDKVLNQLFPDSAIEYGLIGMKSAKAAKIVTEAEDKAKRASRFEEDNMVNAWAKWFKEQYPNVPYTIDKVAQSRSRLGGAIHKAAAYQKGNPDIFVQSAKGGHHGLYIEAKRDDSIFYKGTKILKPGSNNQHIWQSIYHADLREQGYWVMFSISLEATKKITERYMAGSPYKMQVFEYYCKPEDRPMFEGYKNFKPIDRI